MEEQVRILWWIFEVALTCVYIAVLLIDFIERMNERICSMSKDFEQLNERIYLLIFSNARE